MADWKEIPFTRNRRVIHDLLRRARTYHAPVTGSCQFDVTDTIARLEVDRATGRDVGLIALLVRVTALVVKAHPELQQHLFTSWTGRPRQVVFDGISCTLIVARDGPGGEEVLLPLLLRDVDQMDIETIHRTIRDHKARPVEDLAQFRAMNRVKKAPGLALRWFDYKSRSDPDFYLRYFGTYGLSSLLERDGPVHAISTVANTASAFLPTTLRERAWVVDGQVVPRTILDLSAVFDHYLVDGGQTLKIGRTMRGLLEDPEAILGPLHEPSEPAEG